MRLFELAYATRFYAEFTDYDDSLGEFREATKPGVDLDSTPHRKALLVWLNSWGCRQFAVEFHGLASRALQAWGRETSGGLPPWQASLTELSDAQIHMAAEAYEGLMSRTASYRRRGGKEYPVTFGPTGAAKILHAMRPQSLLPWDDPIREAFELDGSEASYRQFVLRAQGEIRALVLDARSHGIAERDIPGAIGRPHSSLPKLVDEYYWVTITRGCSIPTPQDLTRWAAWAGNIGPGEKAYPDSSGERD